MINDVWIIGRGADYHLIVNHLSVSGRHCELRRTAQGWFVTDLGSTNGTYVNGTRIPAHQPVRVQRSDRILLAGEVPMPWPDLVGVSNVPGAQVVPAVG